MKAGPSPKRLAAAALRGTTRMDPDPKIMGVDLPGVWSVGRRTLPDGTVERRSAPDCRFLENEVLREAGWRVEWLR